MRKRSLLLMLSIVLSTTAVFFFADFVNAAPITVQGAFHFRDNRSANTALGGGSAERLTYGATYVVPNGHYGTTGSATQGTVTTPLIFEPFSINPNHFAWSIPYDSSMTGTWALTFVNGEDTTIVQTPEVGTAPQLPFAASVAISGSGLTPTFSWTFPAGYTPDGVRIQIWDLENRLPSGDADIVHVSTLPGDATTFTVPLTLSSGKTLQEGNLYSLEITFALTRGVPLGDNDTILSRSRSFFDFVPLPEGSPPNVFLPIVTPGSQPVYTFNATVVEGQTIFIDPAVAIGYDYAIGAGNPNFASVTLPTGIGDNLYDLYLFNGTEYVFEARLVGGHSYSFGHSGVDRFRILGIEESAGLDPKNTTAFITGLTFGRNGNFTGTMHPIIATIFDDLPIGHWADDFIMAIYDAGITTGCSQNPLNYCPEDNVTREQMAAFIVRAKEGEPPANYCDSGTSFPDVTPDMWSCKYIKRLKELNITTGYQDGTYGPYDVVPREQMAAFLVRAVEGEPAADYCDSGTAFPDVTPDMWSCKYIKRLKELNITTGYQDGTYGPYDLVTRAQMAAFLARAFLGMP